MRTLFFVAVMVGASISGCGPITTCSQSTCDGCCDQTSGMCKAGRETTSCGHDGAFCTPCPSAQACVPISLTQAMGGKCE